MEKIRVVLVEPIYQINLGYIARVAKNFGIKELYLVNPKCNYKGKQSIKYAKHAFDLLSKAKICKSLEEATRHTFVVGTTGIWRKTGASFHNIYKVEDISDMLAMRHRKEPISLLIGRDNTGLSKDELSKCDLIAFIPAAEDYPVLNISHALAILLYYLTKSTLNESYNFNSSLYANKKDTELMVKLFKKNIERRKDIRNKKAVVMSFEHILNRSMPTKKELKALSIALSPRYFPMNRKEKRE
jgi:tRNA/rRNA methyltransferase